MDATKIITIKDYNGSPMTIAETEYNGELLRYDTVFEDMPKTLDNLKKFQVQGSDVWLISYPKSGTHWMYEIIGILLNGKPKPHSTYLLPSLLEMNPDIKSIKHTSEPRRYATHLASKFLPHGLTDKCKVIYIVRNPKSVALSWYHFVLNLKTLEYNGSFNGFLPCFLDGIFNIWGPWLEHVCNYWQLAQDRDNIKVVFYEDFIKDPVGGVKSISDFLGLNHSAEFCENAANLASFQNMREGKGKSEEVMAHAGSYYKENGPKLFRKGRTDEWKEVFKVAENEKFDEHLREKMKKYPELLKKISFS